VGSNPATPTIFLNDFNDCPEEQETAEMSGKHLVSDRAIHSQQTEPQGKRPYQVLDGPRPKTQQMGADSPASGNPPREEQLKSIFEEFIEKQNKEIDGYKALIAGMVLRRGVDATHDEQFKKAGEDASKGCLKVIDNLRNHLNEISDLEKRAEAIGSLSAAIILVFVCGNAFAPSMTDEYLREVAAEKARSKKAEFDAQRSVHRIKAMIPFVLDRMSRAPTDTPTRIATHLRLRNKSFRATFVEKKSPHKVGRTTIERDVAMIVTEAKKIAGAG
jgi:hypothetical protein